MQEALAGFPVESLYAWLDGSVALHCIRGASEYKQFVSNSAHKIREKGGITERHLPTQDNPADLASPGGPVNRKNLLWWNGQTWLGNPDNCLPDIVTTPSPETTAEARATEQIFDLLVEVNGDTDNQLSRSTLLCTPRVGAWIIRFPQEIRNPSENHMFTDHRRD